SSGFLPSTGKLLQFIEPHGPGIRVDSGFAKGDEITHFYDPLLAKLIVYAENRESAIRKMQNALKDFIVHGVITNIDYMQAILRHEDFLNGKVSTRWVEKIFTEWKPAEPEIASLISASLADLVFAGASPQSAIATEADPFNPWKKINSFRN